MAYVQYLSAADLKNVKVPDKIKCDQCQKWKPNDKYSNKQLNDYRRGKRKIRCMGCTIDQRAEMACEGPCSEVKALDKFSKNSRSAHGNHWCEECTNWKATPSAGVATGPGPGQALAPDEMPQRGPMQEHPESLYEADDDDDCTDITSTITSTGAWYNANANASPASGSALPNQYDGTTSVVEDMNSMSINNSNVLPHLLFNGGSAQKFNSTMSTTSVSNPYQEESKKPVAKGVAVWTDVDKEPEPVRSYNAWDSRGNHHIQTRVPSMTTSSVSGSSISSARGSGAARSGALQGGNTWRPMARAANTPAPAAPQPVTQAPQKIRYGIEGDSDSDDYDNY